MAALLVDEPLTGINILTDARHCWRNNAKYSDVVCLGGSTNKCIQVETRHELLGVKRIYNLLDENDCPVNIHAHDNNNQITKYVREEQLESTQNANNTWHMTKGIAKAAKKITSGFKSTRGVVWHEELSDKAAAIKTHIAMTNAYPHPDAKRTQCMSVQNISSKMKRLFPS
ncbi:hypothetical protein MAR_030092 [Mya arenaria]|uniref:Uncharacterized protein n=1 Tax=Mya arenaria TaxID=6604 RepID=A0ABY7DID8_MYAAR|nr:hypothetical protein MAR_030092 [Mya arenaria]